MKTISLLSSFIVAAGLAPSHGMWQRLNVNGTDQGQLVGINPPAVNNPIHFVTGSSIACNTGLVSPLSNTVLTIPAGAKVSAWFEHVLGGAQNSTDADNPIASSHKGPITVYLSLQSIRNQNGTFADQCSSLEVYMLRQQETTTAIRGSRPRSRDWMTRLGNGR
ncbi:hypothetical protein LOCC1_G003530 [Lachnellula occidentalis]|uniref:AA9 family lytic polysaccharide monooxygenase n=1 Tax=Lachnellula occidentalis TaxID=215460 RepID=A0A8H8UHA8_9HELO|nr:hypothetical protein LOCC1_G003530 [Lachnellula occidentalis]